MQACGSDKQRIAKNWTYMKFEMLWRPEKLVNLKRNEPKLRVIVSMKKFWNKFCPRPILEFIKGSLDKNKF